MQTRRIGDVDVSVIGLGGMPMSIEGRPDRSRSIATVHAALDAGITLIDTADAYLRDPGELGHNEMLIAEALRSYGGDTSGVLVATKGGSVRPGDGTWYQDGTPQHLREACDASLKHLGVDAIGLYQFHRPDPKVDFADSVGTFKELHDAGKVRMVGLSNVDPTQIGQAQRILGDALVSVQNQFSPAFRSSEPELELCEQAGLAFLPWSPLGGITKAGGLGREHAVFDEVGAEMGLSPQRVCLAWQLAKSPYVIPIPGASRPETIRDSALAAEVTLSAEQFARLDAI